MRWPRTRSRWWTRHCGSTLRLRRAREVRHELTWSRRITAGGGGSGAGAARADGPVPRRPGARAREPAGGADVQAGDHCPDVTGSMPPDLPVPAGMLIAMRETARLAGFFAAHGIWSVADGGTLTPLLGYEQTDGGRGMDRFAADDTAEAVHAGQDALQANRRGS